MKNLPNEEWINRIGERLRQHTEEPDEALWLRIYSPMNATRPASNSRSVSRVLILLLISAALLVQTETRTSTISLKKISDTWMNGLPSDCSAIEAELKNSLQPESVLTFSIPRNSHSDQINKPAAKLLYPNGLNTKNRIDLKALKSKPIAVNNHQFFQHNQYPLLIKQYSDEQAASRAYETNQLETINHDLTLLPTQLPFSDTIHNIVPLSITESDSIPSKKESEPVKEKRTRALSAYLSLAPLLSYYSITPNRNDGIVVTTISTEKGISMQRLGFRAEAGLQMYFAHRWEWYGGLSYEHQHRTFNYEDYLLSERPVIVPVSNLDFTITSVRHPHTVNYQIKNIGLQAGILYTLSSRFLLQKIGGGFIYQHASQLDTEDTDNSAQKSSTRLLFYQFSYRNEYHFKKKWSIFIQPGFAQSINLFENTAKPFKINPQKMSLSFGIIYCIRNQPE